jgi:hypothetical protein
MSSTAMGTAEAPEGRHERQAGRYGDGVHWRWSTRRDSPHQGEWWRRRELNPRPMDSPCNLLRAYPAFSFRAAQARRRASRLASSLVFSPPPYEPQGSGTVSFGYAQVSRANSTERTSPPLSGECQRLSVGSYWVARFVEITRLRSQVAVSTPPSSPFAPTVTRALYPIGLAWARRACTPT